MIKKIFFVVLIVMLIILLAIVIDALSQSPSVVTNGATVVGPTFATLNGNLVTLGCCTPITIRQNVTKLCAANVNPCTITFPLQTLTNYTIVLVCSFNGGCVTPTDDGGNSWGSTFQNSMNGAADGPLIFQLNGTVNPLQTITLSQGPATNQGSLTAFEVTPSKVYKVTMTQIGPPTNFGVSANYTWDLILGQVMLNWDANCPNNVVFEGVKVNGFSNTANTECMYGMQNNTAGTHVSLTAPNGIRDGNVITLLSTNPDVNAIGFLYGTDPNLIGATNVTVGSTQILTSFSYQATGLNANTGYYFQAWANSTHGFATGAINSFITPINTAKSFGDYGWVFGFIAACFLGLWGAYWIKKKREEHG